MADDLPWNILFHYMGIPQPAARAPAEMPAQDPSPSQSYDPFPFMAGLGGKLLLLPVAQQRPQSAAPGAAATGSPNAAPGTGTTWWLDPNSRDAKFFDQQYDPVREIALKRNVDPAFLLGLAGLESGYGKQGLYSADMNPTGQTPGGDSTPGLKYPSYDAAWRDWDRMWGPRIQNVGSDPEAFINNLSQDNRGVPGTDGRGRYNSDDLPGWQAKVKSNIAGVRKMLPRWQGNLDSKP